MGRRSLSGRKPMFTDELRKFFIIAALFMAVSVIAACAPKAVKQAAPPEPPEALVLPEPPPEPAPPQEAKTAPAPKKTETVRMEEHSDERFMILNFENADIQTVIATFGELMGINYILTPGISGSVTIQSYRKFPFSDLFQIFQSILEINGLAVVKDGAFYRIVPLSTVKQNAIEVEKGKDVELRLDSTFITQLIPLQYIKASKVVDVLRGLTPPGTDMLVYEPTNMLIITAHPRTLVKSMKVIEVLDISETEQESIRTFVYHVENGEAKKLETILKTIYAEKPGEGVAAAPRAIPPPVPAGRAEPGGVTGALPGQIGEVSITAYEDLNALILKCTPNTYLALLEVLKKIDVPVKQVLIEVMVAEISLGDTFRFGIEWLLKNENADTLGFVLEGLKTREPHLLLEQQPGGFSYVLTEKLFSSVIKALATESKLNVLASPHILTVDNKEALIEIGDEIPIATGLTTGTTAGVNVTTGQIQYKTVGTILTVTPRITEKEMVTLNITQEESQIGTTIPIAGQDFQAFLKRKAKTTAVVKSGHTLIIGGLIRETKNKSRSGVPFLSKIPILGYLFSSGSESTSKTELILMVTPHVISNTDEADALTKQFQEKVKTVNKTTLSKKKTSGEKHEEKH